MNRKKRSRRKLQVVIMPCSEFFHKCSSLLGHACSFLSVSSFSCHNHFNDKELRKKKNIYSFFLPSIVSLLLCTQKSSCLSASHRKH